MKLLFNLSVCLFACLFIVSCGDIDSKTIFNGGTFVQTIGDGTVTFYRDPQVISPRPPDEIDKTTPVTVGFIIIYRPGPSAIIPTQLEYSITPALDPSLPSASGNVLLTYVPLNPDYPGPFVQIAPTFWGSFNPPLPPSTTILPLFDEDEYQEGDFYYAIVVASLGLLPEGDNEYVVAIDTANAGAPIDVVKNIKYRDMTITVTGNKVIQAAN